MREKNRNNMGKSIKYCIVEQIKKSDHWQIRQIEESQGISLHHKDSSQCQGSLWPVALDSSEVHIQLNISPPEKISVHSSDEEFC